MAFPHRAVLHLVRGHRARLVAHPDQLARVDPVTKVPELRIIGLELRYRTPDGYLEEVALIPCDVRLPLLSAYSGQAQLNCTVHTSRGDTNFPMNAPLPGF